MGLSPLAGKPAEPSMLANIPRLMTAYYTRQPDASVREQRVAFGTSGHRGSAFASAFNEAHILAISQAICLYRREQSIDGPLFLVIDTHALSEAAFASALEVLAANEVDVMIDDRGGYTPTPVISHAILTYNRDRGSGLADGIVITPSHNPPEDGGFKYSPPHGGPADTRVTAWIQDRATALLAEGLSGVKRLTFERARGAPTTHRHDYMGPTSVTSIVSSSMIDRVTSRLRRRLVEFPSGSSGSSTVSSEALSFSPARKAQALRSCAATVPDRPPTKMKSSWRCWRPR